MKVSTTLLKKINGEPLISGSIISNEDVNEIASGIVQQELTSGNVITNINQQIQVIQQSNMDLSGLLTFK